MDLEYDGKKEQQKRSRWESEMFVGEDARERALNERLKKRRRSGSGLPSLELGLRRRPFLSAVKSFV